MLNCNCSFSFGTFIFLFFFIASLIVQTVHAGPGLHRYQGAHSNYGDDKRTKKHLEEHFKSIAKENNVELSEEDMIYYLFVLHDTNADGYLDGIELREAFTDFEDDEELTGEEEVTLGELTDMVDHVLEEDDKNGDGLISWSEYLESRLYHYEE